MTAKQWRKVAKARKPQQWARKVRSVKGKEVRAQVAGIVWWDYFSFRSAASPWTHLERYRRQWRFEHAVSVADIRRGLVQVGYPEPVAEQRVKEQIEEDER